MLRTNSPQDDQALDRRPGHIDLPGTTPPPPTSCLVRAPRPSNGSLEQEAATDWREQEISNRVVLQTAKVGEGRKGTMKGSLLSEFGQSVLLMAMMASMVGAYIGVGLLAVRVLG